LLISAILGPERSIVGTAAVVSDLPTNGPAMTPDPASDHRVGLAVRDPDPDLFSIGQR
jgi:hypothetical protein